MAPTRNGVYELENNLHLSWYKQDRYEAVRRHGHDLDLQDGVKTFFGKKKSEHSIVEVQRETTELLNN